MSIRNYSLLAVVLFIVACAGAYFSRIVPVPPIAIVSFAALTGLAFQMEDSKLAGKFSEYVAALRKNHGSSAHHAH